MTMGVKLLAGLAITGVMMTGAYAADLIVPTEPQPILASSPDIAPYIKVAVGVGGDPGIFGAGVIALGVDATVSDPVYIGGELQGAVDFSGAGVTGFDFLALGKLGVKVTDGVKLYGTAGVGYFVSNTAAPSGATYAFGGGADFALADNMDLNTELLGIGNWGAAPNAVRGTVGVKFRF